MQSDHGEIRRQLREAEVLNRAAVPRFVEGLKRVFDPRSGVDGAAKAELLGVPSPGRRSFLRLGGVTVLGAAVLAACGDDGDDTASSTTTSTSAAGSEMDVVLAKTAASLEALAVATYDTAARSGLVTTRAIRDAATLFMDHHQQHLDAINEGTGVDYTTPNAAVKEALVDPAVQAAKNETDLAELAYMLEDAAAQTYVFAATALSTPALRSTIMTIGGAEAKHKAILGQLLNKSPSEVFGGVSFFKKDNPLASIDGAVIG